MKKLIIGFIAITFIGVSLNAAILVGENTEGTKKFCHYSDGSTIVVFSGSICPATI